MTKSKLYVRELSAVNPGTGLAWTCQTPAKHDCLKAVVGAVGAYPVCLTGGSAEIARRVEERAKLESTTAEPGALARRTQP